MTAAAEPPTAVRAVEAVARTGMTYRQLDFAVRQGWLSSSFDPDRGPGGSGSRRLFSGTEIRVARVFAVLRRVGLLSPLAARTSRAVVEQVSPDQPVVAVIVLPGVAIVVAEDALVTAQDSVPDLMRVEDAGPHLAYHLLAGQHAASCCSTPSPTPL